MSQIGTQIQYATSTQVPAIPFSTANFFLVGLADWGPSTTPVTIQSLAQTIATVGPRSATNTTVYDSLDVYFREATNPATAIFSRVVGPGASAASLTLTDANASASVLVNATYVGNYGNAIQVAINNTGAAFTVTLSDTFGNTLVTSPSLASRAAFQTWAASNASQYISVIPYANTAGLPKTVTATALSGGTDDRAHVTITQWTASLNAFPPNQGPGQLAAPGTTNTTVPGIWAAIGAAALAGNRVGICDMDDGALAATAVSAIGTAFNALSAGPLGFWSGNLVAPGVTPGTTRSIPPSPVIAALCTRADAAGNPNLPAAGSNFVPQYVTGPFTLVSGTGETYSSADRNTLNSSGINTFSNRFGTFENYGFVSSVLPTTDATFWQFNHFRLRMAIGAEGSVIAEQFVFSQIDGSGADLTSFNHQLTRMLSGFLANGALYGTQPGTSSAAFSVDTGGSVNTAATIQGGNLNANLYVRMSPFAELVTITITSVPITTSVPAGSTTQVDVTATGFTG